MAEFEARGEALTETITKEFEDRGAEIMKEVEAELRERGRQLEIEGEEACTEMVRMACQVFSFTFGFDTLDIYSFLGC